jgi:hypothetical protein
MHLAESAAWALVLAVRVGCAPADLNVDALQRHLAGHGVMLSFFNDLDMSCREPWLAAVQYLGTKGFFPSYDARPTAPLTAPVARLWAAATPALSGARHDAMALAKAVFAADTPAAPAISRTDFLGLLSRTAHGAADAPLARGEACLLCFEASARAP